MKAQQIDDIVDPANFNVSIVKQALKQWIDQSRLRRGFDSLTIQPILEKASLDQAIYMSKLAKTTTEQNNPFKKNTGKRVSHFGGTEQAQEIVTYAPYEINKQLVSYNQVAEMAIARIHRSKKNLKKLEKPELYYIGIGMALNKMKRKIFFSIVLGSVRSINPGIKHKSELEIQYSSSKRGLKPGKRKFCRRCNRFPNIHQLQKGMYIKENSVYLKYDDLRKLKRLLRKPTDGFAVDIIQKKQYPCGYENIYDNSLQSKGLLLKPVYQKKLLERNIYQDKKTNKFNSVIGKIPNRKMRILDQEYELNLIIIQDKHVCQSVTRGYLEQGGIESYIPLTILPDTGTINDPRKYIIQQRKNILKFVVPFEQGKSRYSPKDISPFLEAMDEPKYEILEIKIIAHSSIEGDSILNANLQKKRGESIVKAIQKSRKKTIPTELITSDSWELFKNQINYAGYKELYGLSKSEVKEKLKDPVLLSKMEPILKKERFAAIRLKVKYDMSGENEERYVLNTMRKKIKGKEAAKALRIQKYAINKVMSGKYSYRKLLEMKIPEEVIFVPLILNQYYLNVVFNHEDTLYKDLGGKFKKLYDLAPDNAYILYNYLLLQCIFEELPDEFEIVKIQNKINMMYHSRINKELVDALNLEFQFRIIEELDTNELPNPLVINSLETIKKIYNIKGADWRNALKLAYIFVKHNDLDYGLKLLIPFVNDRNVSEELLFNYISLAAHYPKQIYKKHFILALEKSIKLNKDKYCRLFGKPYLTFQLLDHPGIKKQFCNTCN